MADVAQSLDVPLYDLRDMLSSTTECYYQPHNIHWTVDGNQVVAQYLTNVIARDVYTP
jgi:DNA-binding ferritin-like protein